MRRLIVRRFSTASVAVATLGLLVVGTAHAEDVVRDHDITIDDYPSVAMVIGCVMSPDGKCVAYSDLRWKDLSDRRDTDIWVVPTAGGDARRLTFDTASDSSPQWSPDGKWIYFTSARGDDEQPPYNGERQVWRIAVDCERLVPVTRFEDGVDGYELSKGGRTLYYLVHRDQEDEAWKDLRAKHKDTIDFSHGTRQVSEIWKLNLQNWRTEKLVDDKRYIYSFQVSPDEQRIAMHTTPDSELISNEGWSRVDVFDVDTKHVATLPDELYREDPRSPYGWIEELAWASDSKALAFSVGWDGYPNELFVAEWTRAEPTVRRLRRPTDGVTVGGGLQWRPGTRELCFLGEYHARQHVYSIADIRGGRHDEMRVLTPGDIVVYAFSYGEASSVPAIVASGPTHAREVFIAEAPTRYRQVTDMNPQMATWKMPQISLVSWKGANGDDVEGVLELPYGHDPAEDGPLPMIVELHGGPTASTHIGFRFWCYGRTIMPANGYALLSPNYRGSTGYSDKFMTELIGHENEIEVEDILTGVDAMVEHGIADVNKLGVMGWSNGGFLTNAVITHTTRFKAASSGAGIADMLLQWSIEDTPGHVINYMEGLPWQASDEYFKASPVWKLGDVVTPTLIHCGGEDARVPLAHSRALYRGLHKYCDVPAMLLVYPGQGHGLGKCSMRQAKMEWDLAWFERYILGESDEEADAGAEQAESGEDAAVRYNMLPTHYRIQADLDPAKSTLVASATIDMKARVDAPTTVVLGYDAAFSTSAVYDANGTPLTYSEWKDSKFSYIRINIPNNKAVRAGDALTWRIDYSGTVDGYIRDVNTISEEITELGQALMWYPRDLDYESSDITYSYEIAAPSEQQIFVPPALAFLKSKRQSNQPPA